jgi:polyisoprenoid-binding protein YceI
MAPLKDGPVRFEVDTVKSYFSVQVFAAGIIAVIAHSPKFAVRDFAGEMEFVPGNMEKASVQLMINVGALEIMDEVSKVDRREIERVMFNEVLEKAKYPRIEYRSSRVSKAKTGENAYRIDGDLTLHGITRGVSLDAQIVASQDTLRAQGSFSLMQSDYGLKIASVAGGTLKLRDELKCAYFIVGRRQD